MNPFPERVMLSVFNTPSGRRILIVSEENGQEEYIRSDVHDSALDLLQKESERREKASLNTFADAMLKATRMGLSPDGIEKLLKAFGIQPGARNE